MPEVRVINTDGSQVGILPTSEAIRLAEEKQLDLVEIAPKAQPPVCRILDYGKFKYQQHKKEVEAKKKSTTTTVKELRLGYRTDAGDITRQIDKARNFLEAGDRVKFLLRFRGRELTYTELGRQKLLSVCDALKDVAVAESDPRMEGRMMGVLLAPTKKKKPVMPGQRDGADKDPHSAGQEDEEGADATSSSS